MSVKLPYIQFYPADWTADTRIMSLSARGAWLELIIAMHVRGRVDSVSGSPERLAGLIGCSQEEFLAVLKELKENDIADIADDCNGNVTVTCRRFKNENSEREKTNNRVRKFRSNGIVTEMKRSCNGDVTRESTEDRVQKENIPLAGDTKESTHSNDFPHSVEDVIELSKDILCAMPCSREQAEAYFTDRVSRDWIPYGQQRQMRSQAQICADLKKWLMRDRNNAKERMRNGDNRHNFANDASQYDPADDGSNV